MTFQVFSRRGHKMRKSSCPHLSWCLPARGYGRGFPFVHLRSSLKRSPPALMQVQVSQISWQEASFRVGGSPELPRAPETILSDLLGPLVGNPTPVSLAWLCPSPHHYVIPLWHQRQGTNSFFARLVNLPSQALGHRRRDPRKWWRETRGWGPWYILRMEHFPCSHWKLPSLSPAVQQSCCLILDPDSLQEQKGKAKRSRQRPTASPLIPSFSEEGRETIYLCEEVECRKLKLERP